MPSPLLAVPWEECLLEPVRDRQAEAWLKREVGDAPRWWARYFLAAPWVARALLRLHPQNGMLVRLKHGPDGLADLVELVVSYEHSCRYCYAISRAFLRIMGTSEDRVQALELRLAESDLDGPAAAAVEFGRRMARANPLVTPEDLQALRAAGFDEEECREIAFLVASTAMFNRANTIPALPPQGWEGAPDRWLVRLTRPLLAPIARRQIRTGEPVSDATPASGPCAELIRCFDGSPIAPAMSEAMGDLWRSTALTRRAKALMCAVIARGLHCAASEVEARGILSEEGLSEATIDHALAHLDAPGIEPLERSLMSFARDTLWYEPLGIQRRARRLREELTLPQFVEAVGVAALANGICRLAGALRGIE